MSPCPRGRVLAWKRLLEVFVSPLLALGLLSGCATAPAGPATGAAAPAAASAADPWEAWNRKVYAFNDAVDAAVLKPVAETYRMVLPELVRTGISNVFANIGDVWSAVNNLLQGKVQYSLEMGMRVATNTLFGLGGLLDPASEMGLKRRSEDFGQTLGYWGVGAGPYLVLPLLGPSTLRDSSALVVDQQAGASALIDGSRARAGVTALQVVNLRAGLLSTTRMIDDVALDKYTFVREAFLARRLDAVLDGAAPAGADTSDPGDSPPPPAKAGPR
jgi:phospholipid-binding lipoprotein MlaA